MKRRVLACAVAATMLGTGRPPLRADTATVDIAIATHLLNRLGFGSTNERVEHVVQQGALAYIDEQLHPERLADRDLALRLVPFETLSMTSHDIAERFEAPLLKAQRTRKAQSTDNGPERAETPAAAGTMRQAALPLQELAQAKVLRAVYSERQLQEALVDFWFNHFNVDARKGPTRFMLTEYERDVIRPHVLGRFRTLLGATAKSPAMLFYLDNWLSVDPQAKATSRARRIPTDATARPASVRGLNENYARELLELHTLGVDGGYSQADVTEVARAFSGWTIVGPRQGGGYRFVAAWHSSGPKRIMNHVIGAGGEGDGDAVLDLLASHPATARHITTKLARRFVADAPPAALVDRATMTFLETGGDLRAVMHVLLTSPEFLSPVAVNGKVKTPLDFIASALRATDADIRDAQAVVRALQELGMPLYQCQPPTGYQDNADSWLNAGALVARMNVALSLAGEEWRGVHIGADARSRLLSGSTLNIANATRLTVARATTDAQAIALTLGAPEFQRR